MIDNFNQWAADGGPLELLPVLLLVAAAGIALSIIRR